MEICGLAKSADYLATYGKRLIGVHLHDTHIWHDHHIPGPDGDFDFKSIVPYLNEDTIRVMELSRGRDLDNIGDGIKYLNSMGIL